MENLDRGTLGDRPKQLRTQESAEFLPAGRCSVLDTMSCLVTTSNHASKERGPGVQSTHKGDGLPLLYVL